ncbi:hypothetical protein FOCC_FOCC012895 [Frankliniella occidentalis]|uniref:Uncharacterized protein K02A2.6-like n=1 Tax=Frankliniella occidentalis TaxID=133901 RepID=A0A9C6X381_FRAOC|nr:uncharacterized protein K02A2.6-like [Frankliniella occidentalis]KAE8741558.1 hypothetical protein FOCC_FOCC012895 [Frankliniella occidentalis]
MNAEITNLIQQCRLCAQFQSAKVKEPLRPYPIPKSPWTVLAADAFEYRRSNYLLLVDYYSIFTILANLANLSSGTVVTQLKSVFSQHGAPQVMVSDNGTCFVSAYFKEFAKE